MKTLNNYERRMSFTYPKDIPEWQCKKAIYSKQGKIGKLIGVTLFIAVIAFLAATIAVNARPETYTTGWTFIIMFFFGLIYMLPAYIAICRRHPSWLGIFFLNVFGGLIGFGWLAALVWSGSSIRRWY